MTNKDKNRIARVLGCNTCRFNEKTPYNEGCTDTELRKKEKENHGCHKWRLHHDGRTVSFQMEN